MDRIYLDHNSTTPMLPEVVAAMADCHAAGYANPASQHHAGRRARQALDEARETIGRIVGADTASRHGDRLIFTSGGTEANNLALLGLAAAAVAERGAPGEAVVSAIEHPGVLGPCAHLEQQGWQIHRANVSRDGIIDLEHFQSLLSPRTRFASVMLANNETGVIQPIAEAAALCRAAGIPLHTDAAQAAGKIAIDFRKLGVAAMSISAHKLHGPVGVGALVLRYDVQLMPIMFGGFQQAGLRPGTESIALAVGFAAAMLAYERDARQHSDRFARLRNRLESGLKVNYPAAGGSGIVVNGGGAPRLPHTSNVAFLGLDRRSLLMALDLAGIDCSTGSACASGSSEPSPVLRAMNLAKEIVDSSLRFSLGAQTTADEIDEAVRRVTSVCQNLVRARQAEYARQLDIANAR